MPDDGAPWTALGLPSECEDEVMRRFQLVRDEDVSGVSGTGIVAEGVVFSTGKVVLSWCSEYRSVTVFDAVGDLEIVHGHEGRTRIEWLDVPGERDGES